MRTIHQDSQHSQDSGAKRRPGRPRGSKNRKPRTGSSPAKQQQENQFYYQGLQPVAGTTPPQHPDINVHNQQYYEFQWRVLNLCAEFYNAAEELVVSHPRTHFSGSCLFYTIERDSAPCHRAILPNGTRH